MILLLVVLLPSWVLCEEIIDRYSWNAEPATGNIPDMTRITDIVIGNDVLAGSMDCVDEASCSAWLKSLQERDQGAGLPDLKYNFYVSSTGGLFEGRGWSKQGGFTESYAETSVGIAYLGDYSNGVTEGAETAINYLIKLGYQNGNIEPEFCLLFTCDTGLHNGVLQGPSCPGGTTYQDLASWEPREGVKPKHVYRPCGCGKLNSPANADVSYSSYDVGTIATYSCSSSGFELVGENKRTCEISGAWSDVSLNPPQCVDPSRGLIIVPKKVWDTIVDDKEFITGGFPIATFFVDVVEAYCVGDSDCRSKLKELKRLAWEDNLESDVLCNFYIAKTGIVYEGRGWGVKGAYISDIRQTQGICFLGYDAVHERAAQGALFKLVAEAQHTMKLDFNYCFLTRCPFNDGFCKTVQSWNSRAADRPDYSNRYCEPEEIPEDTRTPASECRHNRKDSTWLNYEGRKSESMSGCRCLGWSDQTTTQHHFYPEVYPYADLVSNYCRNPDMDEQGPWCITDSSCSSSGRDSCAIPQCEGEYCSETLPCQYHKSYCYIPLCPPAVSFNSFSALRYTLSKTKSTVADKLTITFKPDTLNARLIRIEGSDLNGDPDLANYWEVSLEEGALRVIMSMSLGTNVTVIDILSGRSVLAGETSEVQILRKNHLVLVRINGVETKYTHKVNISEDGPLLFLMPRRYSMGAYIAENAIPYAGCVADVTFNKDNLLAVATNIAIKRGEMLTEGIQDDGCLAALPFDWGNIDLFTTAPPTDPKPTVDPVTDKEEVSDKSSDNLPYIIIGVVILVILIVLLIGCVIFKRHNKDKGVYNVDEATTTKWDWKKGILPVFSEEKKVNGEYDKVATNANESPEVFA